MECWSDGVLARTPTLQYSSTPLPLPGSNANWLSFHGPHMMCGFLGKVIGLERAVGLRGWRTFMVPLLTERVATLALPPTFDKGSRSEARLSVLLDSE